MKIIPEEKLVTLRYYLVISTAAEVVQRVSLTNVKLKLYTPTYRSSGHRGRPSRRIDYDSYIVTKRKTAALTRKFPNIQPAHLCRFHIPQTGSKITQKNWPIDVCRPINILCYRFKIGLFVKLFQSFCVILFCVTTMYHRFYQLFLLKSLTYFGARQLLNK